ncbi:MAG: DUF4300 family protein [Anaerotignum sp.]|nr:DUF4300 family protein [Anaerotignum sp.]
MKILKSVKSILGVFLILIMVTALLSACSDNLEENHSDKNQIGYAKDLKSSGITDPYVNPDVKFSNLTSEEDQSELSKDLEKAGINESYIKDYINYVNIYNETAPKSVLNGWNTLYKVNYDPYEINDVWVQKSFQMPLNFHPSYIEWASFQTNRCQKPMST